MDAVLNGARIHYERTGEGMPVVLLHAGVADARVWEPQVQAFARHFDVVRPDMRGFGSSELPPAPWSPRGDLLALMDELQLKPAHLVGNSMGGSLAIDFALDHPERVSKLVIVAGGISGQEPDLRYEHLWKAVEEADKAGDHVALNEAEADLWLDGPYRPSGYVRRELRDLFLEMNGSNMDNDWTKAPQQPLDPPAIGRLSEITAPTLVVVGDKDLEPLHNTADLMVSSIKGAHKRVMRDAAHLPSLEHPEEFNRIVLDFLLS
jgi:pimeloyl-ACP methyl ester carboxylesterase